MLGLKLNHVSKRGHWSLFHKNRKHITYNPRNMFVYQLANILWILIFIPCWWLHTHTRVLYVKQTTVAICNKFHYVFSQCVIRVNKFIQFAPRKGQPSQLNDVQENRWWSKGWISNYAQLFYAYETHTRTYGGSVKLLQAWHQDLVCFGNV